MWWAIKHNKHTKEESFSANPKEASFACLQLKIKLDLMNNVYEGESERVPGVLMRNTGISRF